jgi:hypothetical protein
MPIKIKKPPWFRIDYLKDKGPPDYEAGVLTIGQQLSV